MVSKGKREKINEMGKACAIRIDRLLSQTNIGIGRKYVCTPETLMLLEKIANTFQLLKPNKYKNTLIWIPVDRGTKEDYIANQLEFKGDHCEEDDLLWEKIYPDKTSWYAVSFRELRGIRMIGINKMVLMFSNEGKRKTDPYVHELLEWVYAEVKNVIELTRRGTYNDFLQNNLPYEYRFGRITRKEYEDLSPWNKSKLTNEEKEAFLRYATKEMTADEESYQIDNLTANQFYTYCSWGYQKNQYPDLQGLSPKEQYYRMADGRDAGLGKIDGDSAESFRDWINSRKLHGNPWTVCKGGFWTQIHLMVLESKEGYCLYIDGSMGLRWVESIRFYLALREKGIPVMIDDLDLLLSRVNETGMIGIVPQWQETLIQQHCDIYFSDEIIDTYMYLPPDDTYRQKVIQAIDWTPLEEIRLRHE